MQPRKVIIDTDPGQDDAVAILLALASPEELEILGITTVAGNVPLDLTSKNARIVKLRCFVSIFLSCSYSLSQMRIRSHFSFRKFEVPFKTIFLFVFYRKSIHIIRFAF